MNELTIPARPDEQHGCNVFMYDQIIVTNGGKPGVKCIALGWRRTANGSIEVKTNNLNSPYVPLNQVSIIVPPREWQLMEEIDRLIDRLREAGLINVP